MAKLFTEKLANIEKELNELRNQPLNMNLDFEKRLSDC